MCEHKYIFKVTYDVFRPTQGLATEYDGTRSERIDIVLYGDEWTDWIAEQRQAWEQVTKKTSANINGECILIKIEMIKEV